jgi:antitoxin PrlF
VTSGGRVTLPQGIRLHLGLKPGDKLAFTTLSDGLVVLRPKTRRLTQLAGLLTRSGQPSVSIVELLSMPGAAEVDFEPPRAAISCRLPDWE